MADFSIDDLWWLKTPPPRDRAPAMAMGAQIAARKADDIRQAEQFKTATAMRMMDMMLERERNDISLMGFRAKQTTELLRQKGMAEIGDYLATATANGKLTDPETQAGFWRKTSQYAPYINEQMVNSMWDNTFKSAMDREAKASGGQDATITERDFNNWKLLKKAAKEAPDDETRQDAELELSIFERMKNIGDVASGPPRIDVDFGITRVGEAEQIWSRNPKTGAVTFKSMPKTGITATDQQKIEYASRVKSLQDAFDDRQLKAPDGTRADFNEFQRQLDRLNEEFRTKASPAPGDPVGTNAPPAAADPLGLFR